MPSQLNEVNDRFDEGSRYPGNEFSNNDFGQGSQFGREERFGAQEYGEQDDPLGLSAHGAYARDLERGGGDDYLSGLQDAGHGGYGDSFGNQTREFLSQDQLGQEPYGSYQDDAQGYDYQDRTGMAAYGHSPSPGFEEHAPLRDASSPFNAAFDDDHLLHRDHHNNVRFNEQPEYRQDFADPLASSLSHLDLGMSGNEAGAFERYMDRQDDGSGFPGQHSGLDMYQGDYGQDSMPHLGESGVGHHANFGDGSLGHNLGYDTSVLGYGGPNYSDRHAVDAADQLLGHHNSMSGGTNMHYPSSEAGYSHGTSLHEQDYYGGGPQSMLGDPIHNYDRGDGALQDLVFFQNQLDSTDRLDDAARQSMWSKRMQWEELDDNARAVQWRGMNEGTRSQLGLDGYWAGRLEDPSYFERRLQPAEGHLTAALPLSSPVLNRYSSFFSPDFATNREHHSYIDPVRPPSFLWPRLTSAGLLGRHRPRSVRQTLVLRIVVMSESATLTHCTSIKHWRQQSAIAAGTNVWHGRPWTKLNAASAFSKCKNLSECASGSVPAGCKPTSSRAGRVNVPSDMPSVSLSTTGDTFQLGWSRCGTRYVFRGRQRPTRTIAQLPPSLSSMYRPYLGRPMQPEVFRGPQYELAAAYYDLQRFENELRHAKVRIVLTEESCLKAWRSTLMTFNVSSFGGSGCSSSR
jgi:hypothetical protein